MTAATKPADFYGDFSSLAALKRDAKVDSQKTLRAAAQQFESLFTDMMLKSMRAASIGDSLAGSDELDMYQGMFDQQLSAQLSKGKGLGLADMLVQQLTRSGLVPPAGDSANGNTVDQTVGRASARLDNDVGLKPNLQSDVEFAPVPIPSVEPTASSSSWPPSTPEEFVQSLLPAAQAAAKTLGVDPATLVAHAALETGWGKHVPCNADGSSSFNLFGIKATATWQGQSVGATTLEYEQGVASKQVARFKAYDSPADCFSDYASLLGGAQRYTAARNTAGNAGQFAQALQQGGYATDPHYASKLRAVADAVHAIQVGSTQADT